MCDGIVQVENWLRYPLSILRYIITQVILAFWLILAYDLLEDRRTIDVIISKFFSLCFKMAETFHNLDTILRDCAKHKVQKLFFKALNRYEKQEVERYAISFLENDSGKNTPAVSVGSRARLNQAQTWSW